MTIIESFNSRGNHFSNESLALMIVITVYFENSLAIVLFQQ